MNSVRAFLKANPLAWLLALALLFRLVSLALTPMVNPDSCRYINAAHQFLEGNAGLGLSYAGSLPTYPLLLIAVHALIPDWVLAGQLLSALCLVLAVVPLYLITRDLFGEQAALWSGLAFVLSPELNKYAGEIIREPVFAMVFLWAMYFVRKALVELRSIDFFWVSLLALLAISLRFEMAAFFAGFPLVLLFLAMRERHRRNAWVRGVLVFVAIPAVLLLVLLPVVFGSSLEVRLGGGVNAFLSRFADFDLLGTYPTVYAQLATVEPSFPDAKFAHDAVETTRHLLPLIYFLGLCSAMIASISVMFAMLAAWGIVRRPEWSPGSRPLLVLTGIFLLATYFVLLTRNFISDRYLLAPMLLLLPWVGWGMQNLLVRLQAAQRWGIVACALFVIVPAADTIGNWERGTGVQAVAGRWLRDNYMKSVTTLLVNDERIPLFGGYWMGEYQPYSAASLDGIEAWALEQGSTLIAIRVARKKTSAIPVMKHFKLEKQFEGNGHVVSFFVRSA